MNSDSPPVSWLLVGSVLIMVLVGIASSRRSPKTLRPLSKDGEAAIKLEISPNRVPARLWQDPIEVGWDRIRSIKTNHGKTDSRKLFKKHWQRAPWIMSDRLGNGFWHKIQAFAWRNRDTKDDTQSEIEDVPIGDQSNGSIRNSLIAEAVAAEIHRTLEDETVGQSDRDLDKYIKLVENNTRIFTDDQKQYLREQLIMSIGDSLVDIRESVSGASAQTAVTEGTTAWLNRSLPKPSISSGPANTPLRSQRTTDAIKRTLEEKKVWTHALSRPIVDFAMTFWKPGYPMGLDPRKQEKEQEESVFHAKLISRIENETVQRITEEVTLRITVSIFEESFPKQAVIAKAKNFRNAFNKAYSRAVENASVRIVRYISRQIDEALSIHSDTDDFISLDKLLVYYISLTEQRKPQRFISIVLSGKAYEYDSEIRLRTRFALQEAMEAEGYRPRNSDELTFIPVPLDIDPGSPNFGAIGLPTNPHNLEKASGDADNIAASTTKYMPVTFEVFERPAESGTDFDRYIVLWIDNRIVQLGLGARYDNLARLVKQLIPSADLKQSDVISLAGSEDLKNVLNRKWDQNDAKLKLHYPKSTAPWIYLKSSKSSIANHTPYVNVTRTMPSDDYTIFALLDELERRIPGLSNRSGESSSNSAIWIFAEQDTLYSDVMVESFSALANARGIQSHRVRNFRYLRGIDGNLPVPTRSDYSSPGSVKGLGSLTKLAQMLVAPKDNQQHSFDQAQSDYIQRLADELRRAQMSVNSEQRVKAIGILGSDVYDKLMILQILKKRFPSVWFFTTELDAAYLHPESMGFTRNLLIASAFDTRVNVEESELRVFRDSYQTSIYKCVANILGSNSAKTDDDRSIGIYEVGRSKLIKQYVPKEEKIKWSDHRISVANKYPIDVDTSGHARNNEYANHIEKILKAIRGARKYELFLTRPPEMVCSVVAVYLDGHDLHIAIFDSMGKLLIEKSEADLVKGETLTDLKNTLSVTPFPNPSKDERLRIIKNAISLAVPEKRPGKGRALDPSLFRMPTGLFIAILLLGLLVFARYLRACPLVKKEGELKCIHKKALHLRSSAHKSIVNLLSFTIAQLFVLLMFFVAIPSCIIYLSLSSRNTESFELLYWFEGISIWPSVTMRIIAGGFGLLLLFRNIDHVNRGYEKLRKDSELKGNELRVMKAMSRKELQDKGRSLVIVALVYGAPHVRIFDDRGEQVIDKPAADLTDGQRLQDIDAFLKKDPFPDSSKLSPELTQEIIGKAALIADHNQLRAVGFIQREKECIDRCQCFLVTLGAIMIFIAVTLGFYSSIGLSDDFFTPARGSEAWEWHEYSLIFSLSVLYLTTSWAFFQHRFCRRFIRYLRSDRETDDRIKKIDLPGRSLRNSLYRFSHVASESLFPPFVIVVLLLASRHPVFDGWNIPLGLMFAIGVILSILLWSSLSLFQTANSFKKAQNEAWAIAAEPTKEKKAAREFVEEWKITKGPFGPLRQQPLVQALLFVLAGLGIGYLEPLFKMVGF